MSKIGKIFLTLLAGLMFGTLTWKLFPFKVIKINFGGFILMLLEIALFYFCTWKASAKNKYSLMDKISLWLLVAIFVFLFPTFLIGMRISWFFNTIPNFGTLFLFCGIGLIFSISLIHKLLSCFFTNGLWLLDIIHLTAPFWMLAIDPLKISIGADLTLPTLFKWHSTYVYYGVVICFVILGLFLHQKRGNPQSLFVKNKIVQLERISLKITLTLLMGLFVFVSAVLLKAYSIEVKDLIEAQATGFLTIVGGYVYRIQMAKYLLIASGVCCLITVIMMIWLWLVKEIARAHTQISLILLPLMGISVCVQMILSLSEKMVPLLMVIRPELGQYLPLLKRGNLLLYTIYGIIVFLSYILIRGLLLPKSSKTEEDLDALPSENSYSGLDSPANTEEENLDKNNVSNFQASILNSLNTSNALTESTAQQNLPFENKEDKLVKIMVKVLIGAVIALVVSLATSYYIKSKQPPYNEVVYGNTEVKVKYLTGDMLQFLKENYPQESKRLFVYMPEMEDVTCPYMQDFAQGLKQAKSNSEWTSSYHFMPYVNTATGNSRADAEKKIEQIRKFTETVCGNLCIIDTQENWVFEIKRGDLIPIFLETFKK